VNGKELAHRLQERVVVPQPTTSEVKLGTKRRLDGAIQALVRFLGGIPATIGCCRSS
jgi:hypothetical protein